MYTAGSQHRMEMTSNFTMSVTSMPYRRPKCPVTNNLSTHATTRPLSGFSGFGAMNPGSSRVSKAVDTSGKGPNPDARASCGLRRSGIRWSRCYPRSLTMAVRFWR